MESMKQNWNVQRESERIGSCVVLCILLLNTIFFYRMKTVSLLTCMEDTIGSYLEQLKG